MNCSRDISHATRGHGLNKYEQGVVINYTVDEIGVSDKYTKTISPEEKATSYTITNSYTPEKVTKTVTKVWEDDSNRDRLRPNEIELILYADSEPTDVATPTPVKEGNTWTYTYTNLPKNNKGVEIVYTVTEKTVPNYIGDPQGLEITNYPVIMVTENQVSCVVGINGCVQKYNLYGEKMEDVKRLCTRLDYHYDTAMASIDGSSSFYENTFAYNGVRSTNGESVWLSLGNDEIKNELREAIGFARMLDRRESLEFTTDDPQAYSLLSPEEALELRNMGYNIPDLNNVRVQDIYVVTVPNVDYSY